MKNLEKILSYKFKNESMITRAFIHSSYINESDDKELKSYERLEFLGDAVLQLAISEILFKTFPNINEGDLSKMRSKIVCEDSLYSIANKINLGRYIKFSKGEERSGGRSTKSILADVVESVLAVIYLEESFEVSKQVIEKLFNDTIKSVYEDKNVDDYKSLLQMWTQSKKIDIPRYDVIDSTGPEHNKTFTSAVFIDDNRIAIGSGRSKRISQQEAAKKAYIILTNQKS